MLPVWCGKAIDSARGGRMRCYVTRHTLITIIERRLVTITGAIVVDNVLYTISNFVSQKLHSKPSNDSPFGIALGRTLFTAQPHGVCVDRVLSLLLIVQHLIHLMLISVFTVASPMFPDLHPT